jgi:hypothetical protein
MSFSDDEFQTILQDVENSSDIENAAQDIENAAILRIEEANLWRLLVNQPVFAKKSARVDILDAANRKIRLFAISQLEELLGMSKSAPQNQVIHVESQFEEDEVSVLRSLAAKVLKKDTPSRPMLATPEFAPLSQNTHLPAITTTQAPQSSASMYIQPEAIRHVQKAQAAQKPQSQQAKPQQRTRGPQKSPTKAQATKTPPKRGPGGQAYPASSGPQPLPVNKGGYVPQTGTASFTEGSSFTSGNSLIGLLNNAGAQPMVDLGGPVINSGGDVNERG